MKHEDIPQVQLKSQAINQRNKVEFMCDYTAMIFTDRMCAVVSQDNSTDDLIRDLYGVWSKAFPVLQKAGVFQDTYGAAVSGAEMFANSNIYGNGFAVADKLYPDTWGMNKNVFKHAVPRGVDSVLDAFTSTMRKRIHESMPKTWRENMFPTVIGHHLSKDHPHRLEYVAWLDANMPTFYMPDKLVSNSKAPLFLSLITHKKVQDPATGEVTRTPIIKAEYTTIVPKKVQTRLLKLYIKYYGAAAEASNNGIKHSELVACYEFMAGVWQMVLPVRSTKQMQQRWPDAFDDFCAITGLGQTHGSELVPVTDIANVNNIIADYHKQQRS
jgi:hypothetical protein